MRVTSIAESGMRAGMARLDAAAYQIASAGAGIDPTRPIGAIQAGSADDRGELVSARSPAPPVDTTEALIQVMEAGLTYRANAKVMYAIDRMTGALLDMKA